MIHQIWCSMTGIGQPTGCYPSRYLFEIGPPISPAMGGCLQGRQEMHGGMYIKDTNIKITSHAVIYTVCIYSSIFIISLLFTVAGSDWCVHFNQYIVHIYPYAIKTLQTLNRSVWRIRCWLPVQRYRDRWRKKAIRSKKGGPKNGESTTIWWSCLTNNPLLSHLSRFI